MPIGLRKNGWQGLGNTKIQITTNKTDVHRQNEESKYSTTFFFWAVPQL
jgi:hypothetical protein